MFYNGLEYTPLIVAYGDKNNHVIINKDLQNKFNENLRFAKEKTEKNER